MSEKPPPPANPPPLPTPTAGQVSDRALPTPTAGQVIEKAGSGRGEKK